MRVMAQSKKQGKIKARIYLSTDDQEANFNAPTTGIGLKFYQEGDQKLVCHLIKIDPSKENWGNIKIRVEAKEQESKHKSHTR